MTLSRDVLRTARLYRRLVHEQRVAAELAASQSSRELGGMFQLLATAAWLDPARALALSVVPQGQHSQALAGSQPWVSA